MSNESKNHHYNPQFFLRRWSDDGSKVWSTFCPPHSLEKNTSLRPISRSASMNDLYNIKPPYRNDPGIVFFWKYLSARHCRQKPSSLNFEHSVFQDVDDRAATVLSKIISGSAQELHDLSDHERHSLYKYMYLLQARNPKVMARTYKAMEELLDNANGPIASLRKLKKPNEILNFFRSLREDNNLAKMALLSNSYEDDHIDKIFDGMKIVIMNTSSQYGLFVTSDYPYITFPDIGDEQSIHFFPISPNKCIVMTKEAKWDIFLKCLVKPGKETNAVKLINFVMSVSSRQIFSTTREAGETSGQFLDWIDTNRNECQLYFKSLLGNLITDEDMC